MHVRRTSSERVSFMLNVFMVLAYALGGAALFFWKLPAVPDQNRKILSGVLVLYAGFRAFRLFRKKSTDQ
jgi:hypothetical protein